MGYAGRTTRLVLLAVSGQAIAYLLTVVLARRLGVDGFEAYAVASAAFTLMVMVTPRGQEKYALRILPAMYERGQWGRAAGFLRFGRGRTLATSLLLGTVVALWVQFLTSYPTATKLAIGVSCLSLPAGALVHFYIEVLSANGRDVPALAIFRVAVPLTTLVLVGLLLYLPAGLNGALAVACWGVAWALALVVVLILVHRSTPPQVRQAESVLEQTTWTREARPFLVYRISLALLAQVAVIAIDRLNPSAIAVGAYVAALGTVNLALVLATSTNRYYARRLSVLLSQRDHAGLLALRRERLRWLLPTLTAFLAAVMVFGRDILGLFRPEFVDEGLLALQVLAVSIAVTVLFSLSPTYLKYTGQNRLLLRIVVSAAVLQIILLVMLVPKLGATGAAIAYAVSMSGMYLVCARTALGEIKALKATSEH